MIKCLLVEDDLILARSLANICARNKILLDHVVSGVNISRDVLRYSPDIIILDINLPGPSGFDILRKLPTIYDGPVIMLTAYTSDKVELTSFQNGAVDFIKKGTHISILLARINTAVSAHKKPKNNDNIKYIHSGGVMLDIKKELCTVDRKPVQLTLGEMNILFHLMKRENEIITRNELFLMVKGYAYDGISRAIDLAISRIRNKLIAGGLSKNILVTYRGSGYKFDSAFTSIDVGDLKD